VHVIELPEAVVLSRQIEHDLSGKQIVNGNQGNASHRFAFYSQTPQPYETILAGKQIGGATYHGSAIMVWLEPDYVLVLGGGGERILHHKSEATFPKKYHLYLQFHDDTWLTATVQGWGNAMLLLKSEASKHPHVGETRVSPLNDAFTLEHLNRLFNALEESDPRSIKYFLISDPGVWGVGNGYLQDILFHAKIHPRRRAVELAHAEIRALHQAIRNTLSQAVDLHGRDTERDMYNQPGGYRCVMDRRSVGQPCSGCGTTIEKIHFLGGACYICPQCQG
jgi:formamidopyrimidine-DNA glycosylase